MKFIVCVFAFCTFAFANGELCEKPCSREYFPVCGTDGKHFKLFGNPCMMRNEHCRDGHNWLQVRMADCPTNFEEEQPCERPCTREYKPVCGTDGKHFKRFSNLCMLRNEHCKNGNSWFETKMESCLNDVENEEPVQKPGHKNCALICPALYAPVCGFNGKMYKQFSNKCMLQANNCHFNNHWKLVGLGECA